MSSTITKDKDVAQMQIRFITKQEKYTVPNYPLSVPTTIVGSDLNDLVNELLKESDLITQEKEFDFLIFSEFLRTPLIEHIGERGISTEQVVEIEYVERHLPPEPQDCFIHDDWVSAVAVSHNWILTGCYDNTVHIWTTKGKHNLVIPGHTSPIKAVAWITVNDKNASFVSASQDQTAIIWDWNITSNSVDCVHICKGHERGLEAVGVNETGVLMATGSWDTMLKIWSTTAGDDENKDDHDNNDEDGKIAAKRSKRDHGKIRIPKRTMKGHKEALSGVVWTDKHEIVTSSWDHTLRIWDSELGGIKQEIPGSKSFFDVDYSCLSRTLITASADRHIRLFDPRSNEGSIVKATFSSHTQWVQSVRWSTTDEYLFLSGAYDNNVKLWDSRSPKASLFDLLGHEDKILACDWSNPKLVVSGGADNTVRIFKTKSSI